MGDLDVSSYQPILAALPLLAWRSRRSPGWRGR